MATILLQAAGAYLGGFLGSVGGAIGSAVGALAGYTLDRALINSTQHIEGPRLASARPFTAEEGVSIPRLYGTARLGGVLIWATRFEESRTTRRQGKMGPKVTEYSYYANAAFLLCEGEVAGIRRVWADGQELDLESIELRIYRGDEGQSVDPLIEAKQGTGNTPAYRGTAYVVLDRLDIGQFGNRVPQLQFEIIRPVGKLSNAVKAVSLLPGSTEYGLSPVAVTRQNRPGEREAINRNVLFAGTDIAASLNELQATCPNLCHVALIIAWFGDDLRAGHCKIRPAVTDSNGSGLSSEWVVSGIARDGAHVVSQHDGAAAYGGTPSDRSVLDAIAEIKARGIGVTLYPFIMMDIADGNSLPNPYGGTAQPAYPWRGRIASDPAPYQEGSADKTAQARLQITSFCGDALYTQFSPTGNTIGFTGTTDDWGYRRFILHYAHLAVAAGGVDSFLIGSELRGLTTLRDETAAFPFVEQLADLCADVRSVVGSATQITYGADWSEYFGFHPADGSGDVYFHLDALWAHPAMDAVGIDNYMPLADWRDADYSGDNPDGFAGPYDPAGLKASIAGGEGFDWYYPSTTARAERERAPITDGMAGKPWVYRYKDIVNWWTNQHFDRVGGAESVTPSSWVPASKPIWFTELGCPAVDKGPNQPNVFPDPKSAENASPYFSHGGRSDIAQHRFLNAHLGYWDDAVPEFDDRWNPVSSVYGGRMVDVSRIYLWAWDARPFPAFPQHSDLWTDGANWSRGHWLNGRVASPAVSTLINAILADHGQLQALVDDVDGIVHGYVIADPTTPRSALEPLLNVFDLNVIEDADQLIFRQAVAGNSAAIEITELAMEEDAPIVETVRSPDHELPVEAMLAFVDPFTQYQSGSVRTTRQGGVGRRQKTISFPGVMEKGQAVALLDDWLKRAWFQRETVTFSVTHPRTDIVPGSIVRLPATGNSSDFLVTGIEDGLVRKVSARQVAHAAPTPWRELVTPAPTPILIATGQPHALFLDLPTGLGTGPFQDQFRVAVWQKPWRGQALYVSPEETGFVLRELILKPASLGRLSQALAPGFEGRRNRFGSLTVELFDAEIASVSTLQLLNGANAAAVKSATGVWEILQFQSAQEIAPQIWQLSHLLRGQLGTSDAMAAGAPAGADFVILDSAVEPAGLQPSEAGLTLNWRIGATGSDLSGANFMTSSQTGGRRSLLPLAPVHLRAKWVGDDLVLSWIRRGRVDADKWEGSEIPLGEETEEYQLQIATVEGTMLRALTTSEPEWLYSSSDIAIDFGTPPMQFDITVRQLSMAVGWGVPATQRFTVS